MSNSTLTFATTTRTVEVGNLYVGDLLVLPGGMLTAVLGFDFTVSERPGIVGVVTDLAGVQVMSTTERVQVAA